MRKLKLDLADLAVDSFEAHARGPRVRGTLFGQSGHASGTEATDCWGLTCPACGDTAYVFCTAGCGDTNGCGGGSGGDTCTCPDTGQTGCAECASVAPCTSHAGEC